MFYLTFLDVSLKFLQFPKKKNWMPSRIPKVEHMTARGGGGGGGGGGRGGRIRDDF